MNYHVDIHSNLLPVLAGAGNPPLTREQSLRRISAMRDANIKHAVAAPLFHPEYWSPEEFLALRDEQIAGLVKFAQPMRIVPGAVLPLDYCEAHIKELRRFAIGGSGYFLLDLPDLPVDDALCERLSRLQILSGMCPIAVDIDRYFGSRPLEEWTRLGQTGLLMQISIDGLLNPVYRKLTLFLLANQYAHFTATGGRSIAEPLRFVEAMRVMQRSLPAQIYRRVKGNPAMLLSDAAPGEFISG